MPRSVPSESSATKLRRQAGAAVAPGHVAESRRRPARRSAPKHHAAEVGLEAGVGEGRSRGDSKTGSPSTRSTDTRRRRSEVIQPARADSPRFRASGPSPAGNVSDSGRALQVEDRGAVDQDDLAAEDVTGSGLRPSRQGQGDGGAVGLGGIGGAEDDRVGPSSAGRRAGLAAARPWRTGPRRAPRGSSRDGGAEGLEVRQSRVEGGEAAEDALGEGGRAREDAVALHHQLGERPAALGLGRGAAEEARRKRPASGHR